MQNQAAIPVRLIPLTDVLSRVGMGKSRTYELLNAGKFPKPLRHGRKIVFVDSEIDAWINQRIEERNKQIEAAGTEAKP